jgi:TPR repeat protein
MKNSDIKKLQELLDNGALQTLSVELEPFLKKDDLDARYLACQFSVDPSETGEAFDIRRIDELKALAAKWHRASLFDLACAYRHGDDVEQDNQKFQNLLSAAALLGHQDAAKILSEHVEFELGQFGLSSMLEARE